MKEFFKKAKAVCVEKIEKIKEKCGKVNTKVATITSGITAMVMASPLAVFAEDLTPDSVTINSSVDAGNAISNLIGLIITLVRYIGIVFVAIGVYQFAMSMKDQDANEKSRSIQMLIAGCAMIGLKSLLKGIGVIS